MLIAALDAGFGVEGFDPIGPRADAGPEVLTLVLGVLLALTLLFTDWLTALLLLSVSSLPDEVYEVGLELTLLSIFAATRCGKPHYGSKRCFRRAVL